MTTVRPIINTATHRGAVRENNQDVVRSGARWALVADGMGGGPAGDKAAAIVAECVGDLLDKVTDDHSLAEALAHGVTLAELDIETEILDNHALKGMGSTVVAAYVENQGHVRILNIGDSRCYALSDGELTQITVDDSLKQRYLDAGVDDAELLEHVSAVLTNAITGLKPARPRHFDADVSPGDRLLLCSDGLSDMIDDAMIAEILDSDLDGETTARTLIEAAMSAGGLDNISAAIIDIAVGDTG